MRWDLGLLLVATGFALACEGNPVGLIQEESEPGSAGIPGAMSGDGGRSPSGGESGVASDAGASSDGRAGGSQSGGSANEGGSAGRSSSGGVVNHGGSATGGPSGGDSSTGGSSESLGGGGSANSGGNSNGGGGGGSADSGGNSSSGGGGGSAGDASGGSLAGTGSCTPLLSVASTETRVAPGAPSFIASTDTRACWRESPNTSTADFLHCATAEGGLVDYEFEIQSGSANDSWELAVSDDFILHRLLNLTSGEGTLYVRALTDGSVSTSRVADDFEEIALDGDVAYFVDAPTETLMQWRPLSAEDPSVVATLAELGLVVDDVVLMTAFGGRVYVAESRRITRVDPTLGLPDATPVLDFSGSIAGNPPIDGTSGSLVASSRGLLFKTDSLDRDDYYVAFSGIDDDEALTPFVNLKESLQAQAAPAGCAPGDHYPNGQGTLYSGQSSDYYIYPGEAGLFAVAVREAGIGVPQLLVVGSIANVFVTRGGDLWADYQEDGAFGEHVIFQLEPSLEW